MDSVGSLFLGLRNRFHGSQIDTRQTAAKARTSGYQAVLSEDPQTPVQDPQSPSHNETSISRNSLSKVPVVLVPVALKPQSLSDMKKIVNQFILFLKNNEVDDCFRKTESGFFYAIYSFCQNIFKK